MDYFNDNDTRSTDYDNPDLLDILGIRDAAAGSPRSHELPPLADEIDSRCRYGSRCKDYRFCKDCAEIKAGKISKNIHERTTTGGFYIHGIFTLPSNADSPRGQVDRLHRGFAVMRRLIVAKCLTGGVRKAEASRNDINDLWTSHLHVLAEVSAAPDVKGMEAAWFAISQGGGVEVIMIDSDDYRRRCARYVAKPPHAALLDRPDALRQWNRDTRGMRLISTFGNFRNTPLLPRRRPAIAVSNTLAAAVPILLDINRAQSYIPTPSTPVLSVDTITATATDTRTETTISSIPDGAYSHRLFAACPQIDYSAVKEKTRTTATTSTTADQSLGDAMDALATWIVNRPLFAIVPDCPVVPPPPSTASVATTLPPADVADALAAYLLQNVAHGRY